MRRALRLALAGWLFAAPAAGQIQQPPIGIGGQAGQALGATTPFTSTDGTASRSAADRAADRFNPRDFGAKGDGASHTVSATLGISTLAGLTAYTVNGVQPYAFAGSYPYGTLFNLPAATIAAAGSSTLSFGVSQSTGATTASGAYAMTMADVGGISQGMIATASGIPSGTQVEWVNPANLQIGLSAATTASIAAGASVAFVSSWLSHVTTGMQVSGAGVPGGATVTAVGSTTVTLSAPLTAATVAPTAVLATTPASEGTAITFYAPFTDAQAAALQMDGLGIQAAILAAGTGGGIVKLPAAATGVANRWLLSHPLVFAVSNSSTSLSGSRDVTLEGEGYSASQLVAAADFGPGNYALSCGDPSATAGNGRGIWAGGGSFCHGEWRGFGLTLQGAAIPRFGARPQISGVPVAMGGVRQGPRRGMRNVTISGFNVGDQFQGDWTTWDYVTLTNNFDGLRFDDPMPNLFGDLRFEQVFFGGNAFAGVAVSPQASIQSARFNKSWIADQPYGVWIEPGMPTPSTPSIQQTVFDSVNFESAGCAMIADGNVLANGALPARSDSVPAGRTILSTEFRAPYASATPAIFALASGCPWAAYIDVANTWQLAMTNVREVAFAPVTGGQALIRTHRTNDYANNRGGVWLSGDLKAILDLYAAAQQEIVSGGTLGSSSDFYANRAQLNVEMTIPGVGRFKEYYFNDYLASPAAGLVLESGLTNGLQSAERAGLAGVNVKPLLGVLASTWPAAPQGQFVPVMVEGQAMPVHVAAAQAQGAVLQVDPSAPGNAASGLTGRPLGYVTDPNGGSTTLVYMQASYTALTAPLVNLATVTPLTTTVTTSPTVVYASGSYVGVSIGTTADGSSMACTGDGSTPVIGVTPTAAYPQGFLWPAVQGGSVPSGPYTCIASVSQTVTVEAH